MASSRTYSIFVELLYEGRAFTYKFSLTVIGCIRETDWGFRMRKVVLAGGTGFMGEYLKKNSRNWDMK